MIFSSRSSVFAVPASVAVILAAASPAPAQPQRALGVDVSYWNRGSSSASANGITQTAWNTAYGTPNANGYTRQFVWIRATRGGTTGLSQGSGTPGNPNPAQETLSRRYDDPEFLRTVTRATTAGLFAGQYHYARPDNAGNTGTDEADHFIEYASAYMRPGYLMPIFDLETGSGGDTLAQFAIDFANRLFDRMRIRPAIYINGNYSSILQGATAVRRNQLAQPPGATPSVVGPAYPMLWNARYSDNANPEAIPVQTGSPKDTYTTLSLYYGPWDDYGNSAPWAFWQYASTVSVPGITTIAPNVDGNVSHGDMEFVKNYLVPAVWWSDISGDWSTLTNWNSGQPLSTFNGSDLNNPPAPYTPRVGDGQTTPFTSYTLPSPRLPGAAGSGPTSGQHDTVILERPNANIVVTLSTGNHNIRKLYMRETLNLTGGSLMVNYNPTYRADDSADVLHGGPVSAQFSGPVAMSNAASFTVHTLQVDANRIFTLAGGTLTFNQINLMPHSTTPAKILVVGNVNLNPHSNNVTANIVKGTGAGSPGSIDLAGGDRSLTVGNGSADVDVTLDVSVSNGALTKAGAGTLRLTSANTYAGGTTVSGGRLLVNNPAGSGTGTGAVAVNSGGTLGGTGIISGVVTANSGGTISPGMSIGTLTLNSPPVFNGTNFMEINRNGGSSLADRIVLTSGTLNYGGTLVVSNLGATLTGGEVFTNFAASAYSGAFAATILPTPNSGLNWYLGHLTVNGTIKVNRSPVANPVAFTNLSPPIMQIPIASLLASGADADGDALSLAGISPTTINGIPLLTNSSFIFYSNSVGGADQFSYTISDGRGGSATANVNLSTVNVPPDITCPVGVSVPCFTAVPAPNPAAVISSSACGPVTNSFVNDAAVTNACVITITRTYRATDACGLSSDCQQIITVHDAVPPVIDCPTNIAVQDFVQVPAPDVNSVSATDDCGGPVIVAFVSDIALTNAGLVTITRTYSATDTCANAAQCSQTITVAASGAAQFQLIQRLSDGHVRLLINSQPGGHFWLDRATNLVDWLPLANLTNTNGMLEFIDESATNFGSGFYRTRQ